MAAKTTWGPAPWLPKQTWLLKDNSVVQTPDLETTPAMQRVRIAGTTKSFGKNQVNDMLADAVKQIAANRLTTPWVRLLDDDAARRSHHGSVSPGPGSMPDFTQQMKLHCTDPADDGRHTQIVFEYVSEDCPGLTAMAWVIVSQYGYSDKEHQRVHFGLTHQTLHDSMTEPTFQNWTGADWYKPFGYYDNGPEVDAATSFLSDLEPIPGFEPVNESFTNARNAVITALKMVKTLRDIEYIDIPQWREKNKVTTGRYRFKRTNLTNTLYQELVDFIQTKPTMERIRQNYEQIQQDLRSLGIVTQQARHNDFLEIVEQSFAEDVVCHMIPLTEEGDPERDGNGNPEVVQDHGHTISVDLLSGTIVVNCSQRDAEVLEHWNFERTKAELHGELDAFLGFARQKQAKRVRKSFNKIVKHRTPEEVDVDNLSA